MDKLRSLRSQAGARLSPGIETDDCRIIRTHYRVSMSEPSVSCGHSLPYKHLPFQATATIHRRSPVPTCHPTGATIAAHLSATSQRLFWDIPDEGCK
ncbi:hypothetical protein Ac2012v2_004540 [Leucoagaricus gongylophorus]